MKKIECYEGGLFAEVDGYFVMNNGDVYSLDYNRTGKMKKMTPVRNKQGYLSVRIHGKWFRISRLVAMCFIPNPDNLQEVNHLTEDKQRNQSRCLSWCTSQENSSYGTRGRRISEKLTNGPLSRKVAQYTLDGVIVKEWLSVNEVKRKLGFSPGNISKCCKGKRKSAHGFVWCYSD